jgi:hypothetical protein
MALTAENVVVGISGKVYVAPVTATAPTSSVSALTTFEELGYVSADGIEIATDKSTSQIRGWQNSDLVRETITEATSTFAFTLLETSEAVLELYFGATVVAGKLAVNPTATGGRKSFVIDIVDGDKVIRHYIPSGEVLSVDSIMVANGEALAYSVTVTCYVSEGRTFDSFYGEFETV